MSPTPTQSGCICMYSYPHHYSGNLFLEERTGDMWSHYLLLASSLNHAMTTLVQLVQLNEMLRDIELEVLSRACTPCATFYYGHACTMR